jgi:hypothetical protein
LQWHAFFGFVGDIKIFYFKQRHGITPPAGADC